MEILIKHYGKSFLNPSSSIELTVKYFGTQLTVGVTDLKGNVNNDLIETLRQIADELEEQNNKVKLNTNAKST